MNDFLVWWSAFAESRPVLASALGATALVALSGLVFTVTRRYLLAFAVRVARGTATTWDDAVIKRGVLRRAAALAPLVVLYYGLPLVPNIPEDLDIFLQRLVLVAAIGVVLAAINGLLSAVNDVYVGWDQAKGRPIKGYVQLVQIFVTVLGLILITSLLLERSPWALLTGLGAMTAVLMLIFQDTIRSFVASLQLVSNDMVRIGDWISLPKYGADGDVIDIALHTVKIQNWDKTISTVPTYKLIEDSVTNWRGMQESGGRRIKRSISLDMTSVRFLRPDDFDRFQKFFLLEEYIAGQRARLEQLNADLPPEKAVAANERNLTNLGTFRAYVTCYLQRNPEIHTEGMTFLVRQLPPSPTGVPIEIYVFTKDTRWVYYEGIQADIFDHLLAIVPEFDLRVFQEPTGADFARLNEGGSP